MPLLGFTTFGSAANPESDVVDTTGADLYVWSFTHDFFNAPVTPGVDNHGNTFSNGYVIDDGVGLIREGLAYIVAPVGAGPGTIFSTTTAHDIYMGSVVSWWSGCIGVDTDPGTSHVDVTDTNNIQPGAQTPANSNTVVIGSCGNSGPPGIATYVDSPFMAIAEQPGIASVSFPNFQSYLFQETPAPVNPTFSLTGSSAAIIATTVIFKFSPHVATDYTLSAANGSFALTGQIAGWIRGILVAAGSFALTGIAAFFRMAAKAFPADTGYFALTGNAANLHANEDYTLLADPGFYTLTGFNAKFCKAKAWPKVDCSDSPWVKVRTNTQSN